MRAYTTVVLVATLVGAFAAETSAQVTKPRNLPPSTGRLPAPARISAFQQPDGKIRVVWSPVKNAFEYALVRSVPPDGATAVALPNPSDTVYVDSDVKPGSTYYYVVTAQDGEQVGGMKASAPPVKVESRVAVDTAKTPADSTKNPQDTPGTVTELTEVRASYRYPTTYLGWSPIQNGVRFLIERAEVTAAGQSPWQPVRNSSVCCQYADQYLERFPTGTRLIYRVTVMDSATQTNQSMPKQSNEVVTYRIAVKPTLLGAAGFNIHVSPTASLRIDKNGLYETRGLRNVRWASLNDSLVTIDQQGMVRGLAVGISGLLAIGETPDGSLQFVVYPTNVMPMP